MKNTQELNAQMTDYPYKDCEKCPLVKDCQGTNPFESIAKKIPNKESSQIQDDETIALRQVIRIVNEAEIPRNLRGEENKLEVDCIKARIIDEAKRQITVYPGQIIRRSDEFKLSKDLWSGDAQYTANIIAKLGEKLKEATTREVQLLVQETEKLIKSPKYKYDSCEKCPLLNDCQGTNPIEAIQNIYGKDEKDGVAIRVLQSIENSRKLIANHSIMEAQCNLARLFDSSVKALRENNRQVNITLLNTDITESNSAFLEKYIKNLRKKFKFREINLDIINNHVQ
jgi:hypothetical protein